MEEEDGPFGLMGPGDRMIVMETTDSQGNTLRRIIPAQHSGNPFDSRGPGGIGSFFQLLELLALNRREVE